MSKWEKIYYEPEPWNRLLQFRNDVAELYGIPVTKVEIATTIFIHTDDGTEYIPFHTNKRVEKLMKEQREKENE